MQAIRFDTFVQVRDVINEELEVVWSGQKNARTALGIMAYWPIGQRTSALTGTTI